MIGQCAAAVLGLAALVPAAAAGPGAPDGAPLAKITVIEPSGLARRAGPVTLGVPLARGANVADPRTLALVRADRPEVAVPASFEPLARWEAPLSEPLAPLRWVRLDALVPLAARESVELLVVRGSPAPPAEPLGVASDENAITIDAGSARFTIPTRSDAGISRALVRKGDAFVDAIAAGTTGGLRIERAGEAAPPFLGAATVPASASIEWASPVRATVEVRSSHRPGTENEAYDGALDVLETVTRYEFFASLPLVRVTLTVQNPDKLKAKDVHKGGPDVAHVFEDLSWRLGAESERGGERAAEDGEAIVVYQDSSGSEKWGPSPDGSPFHATTFRGYKVLRRTPGRAEDEEIGGGLRADGILERAGHRPTAAVALHEMSENYPKALRASPRGAIDVGLFPREWSVPHVFRGGLQKTHRFSFAFAATPFDRPKDLLRAELEPPFAKLDPVLVRDSLAAGLFAVEDRELFPLHEAAFDALLDYRGGNPAREGDVFRELEEKDLYGWLDWGDHYRAGSKSSRYFGNNEFDFSSVFLTQDLRAARFDSRWRRLGAAMARHLADVDVYHTDRDLDWANRGIRKHDASGVMDHRREPSLSHFWVGGLSLQAFAGADPVARDTLVREIGVHLRARERRPGEFAYAGEVRSRGWYLVAIADLYEATGDSAFLSLGQRAAAALVTGALAPEGFLGSPEYRKNDEGDVSPWQMGIACEGVGRYAWARSRRGDPDPAAEASLVKMLAFLRDTAFDAKAGRFPYVWDSVAKVPRPHGAHLSQVLSDGFAYGYLLTGDASFLEIGRRSLATAVPPGRYPVYYTTTLATAAKNGAMNLRPGRPLMYVAQKSDRRRDAAPPVRTAMRAEGDLLRVEADEPARAEVEIVEDGKARRFPSLEPGFRMTHRIALPDGLDRARASVVLTDLAGNESRAPL